MSLAQWATNSHWRLRNEPLRPAVAESVRELYRGARRRVVAAACGAVNKRTLTTSVAGASGRFVVNSPTAVARAWTLNREEPVAEWLFQDLDGDSVLWDVGAYHGHYAVLAAGHGATVRAFEPLGANHARLEEHTQRLNTGDVTLDRVALSNETGKVSITPDGSTSTIDDDAGVTVQTRRGDDYNQRPTHVKVDVEGHETAVLDGMSDVLANAARVVVEVHEHVAPAAVASRLSDAGLHVTVLRSERSETHLGGVRGNAR